MSDCKQHGTPLKLKAANGGYTYESCTQCEEESRQRMKFVMDGIAGRKSQASVANSKSLARWIWCKFVGIPITEPYDKEFNDLLDHIEKFAEELRKEGEK